MIQKANDIKNTTGPGLRLRCLVPLVGCVAYTLVVLIRFAILFTVFYFDCIFVILLSMLCCELPRVDTEWGGKSN